MSSKPPQNLTPDLTPTIDDAIEKTKQVAEEIKSAAEELDLVHAVLDTKIPEESRHADVGHAIARTDELEERLSKSADALDDANKALERVADAQREVAPLV